MNGALALLCLLPASVVVPVSVFGACSGPPSPVGGSSGSGVLVPSSPAPLSPPASLR